MNNNQYIGNMLTSKRPLSSSTRRSNQQQQQGGSKQTQGKAMMKISPSELILLDADSVEREFRSVDTLSQDILEQMAGTPDLDTVRELRLQVNTLDPSASVSQLGNLLPKLYELDLNGSFLSSFRDLGTSLRNLRVLRLEHGEMRDLDGIGALCGLEELFIANNAVHDLTPLAMHERIRVLDLRNNDIHRLQQVDQLGTCPNLQVLWVEGNPISAAPTLRQILNQNIPTLQTVNGRNLIISDRETLDETIFFHVMNMRFPSTYTKQDRAEVDISDVSEEDNDRGNTLDGVNEIGIDTEGGSIRENETKTEVVSTLSETLGRPLSGHAKSPEDRGWLHTRGAANAFDKVTVLSGSGSNARLSVLGRRMQESQSQAKLSVRDCAEKGEKAGISYSSEMTHGSNNVVFAGNLASSTTRRRRQQQQQQQQQPNVNTEPDSNISPLLQQTPLTEFISVLGDNDLGDKSVDDILEDLKRWKTDLEANFADLQSCKQELQDMPNNDVSAASSSSSREYASVSFDNNNKNNTVKNNRKINNFRPTRPTPPRSRSRSRIKSSNAVVFSAEDDLNSSSLAPYRATLQQQQQQQQQQKQRQGSVNGGRPSHGGRQYAHAPSMRPKSAANTSVTMTESEVDAKEQGVSGTTGRTTGRQQRLMQTRPRRYVSPRLLTQNSNPNQYEEGATTIHTQQQQLSGHTLHTNSTLGSSTCSNPNPDRNVNRHGMNRANSSSQSTRHSRSSDSQHEEGEGGRGGGDSPRVLFAELDEFLDDLDDDNDDADETNEADGAPVWPLAATQQQQQQQQKQNSFLDRKKHSHSQQQQDEEEEEKYSSAQYTNNVIQHGLLAPHRRRRPSTHSGRLHTRQAPPSLAGSPKGFNANAILGSAAHTKKIQMRPTSESRRAKLGAPYNAFQEELDLRSARGPFEDCS